MAGNVYVAFSSGFTPYGGSSITVKKLDTSGNLIWTKSMVGTSHISEADIIVDASGQSYIIGYFEEEVDFDPGENILNMTSNGDLDVFVQKLDASGSLVWVKQIGSEHGVVYSSSIAVDALGQIYLTGLYDGIIDFDPGEGIKEYNSGWGEDIFTLILDTGGNIIWSDDIGESFAHDRGNDIVVDNFGNFYVTGSYIGEPDFDPTSGSFRINTSSYDIFVLKLSNSFGKDNKLGISIFPNPTTDIAYINKGNNEELDIHVIDSSGRLLFSTFSTDQFTTLDLSNYAAGFYIVSVRNKEGKSSKVVIKL